MGATGTLRLTLTPGQGPSLNRIARKLRAMNEPEVAKIFRRRLRDPVAHMREEIRIKIMAIPTHDGHSGLRVRLARCVRVASRTTGREATVAVYMDPRRMPDGQLALPLTMEGIKVWRHPVFATGSPETWRWVTQEPHPYFYPVVAANTGAARLAIKRALEDIKRYVDG